MMLGIADSAGNLFAVGGLLKQISEIGQETGCTIVLCHHTKKGVIDPFEPPELEDIAWSGFQEFARQWFLIGRRKKYDPDQKGYHELWLNVGGSAGHSGMWGLNIAEGVQSDPHGRRWDVDVLFASEARQQAEEAKHEQKEAVQQSQREKDRKAIQNAMQAFPQGETQKTIRESIGMSGTRFSPVFTKMISDGEVVSCGEIKKPNGHLCTSFKLIETTGTTGTA